MCSPRVGTVSQDSADRIIDTKATLLLQLEQRLVLNECDSCSIRPNVILAKMLLVPQSFGGQTDSRQCGLGDSSLLQDPSGLRLPATEKAKGLLHTNAGILRPN